jgi:hypothetical protein
MEWLHHLSLVFGGLILGIGMCLRLLARRQATYRPSLGWGVMALGFASILTGFAPTSPWTSIPAAILTLAAIGLILMSTRPQEPESQPAPVRFDR